jgi:hypothetical protein
MIFYGIGEISGAVFIARHPEEVAGGNFLWGESRNRLFLFARSNEENAMLAWAFDECRDSPELCFGLEFY